MISLQDVTLSSKERTFLNNDAVGGVILFSRNYRNKIQLKKLISSIRTINPQLLIAVDHEGGRVWRFKKDFTVIPAMKTLGDIYKKNPELAVQKAYEYGYTLAKELRECDIDFSFTPVLDIDYAHSIVIGDRAFADTPEVIITLSTSLINGLHDAGMISIGKHYPGHGYASADSHLEFPVDNRSLKQMTNDINIFKHLSNKLDAVMTAHILYPKFDKSIATFSKKWLTYLKTDLHFKGIIFSDDLSMMGAKIIPDVVKRINTALHAGCDMILLCNDIEAIHIALSADYPKHPSLHTLQGSL